MGPLQTVSTLFVIRTGISTKDGNDKIDQTPLHLERDLSKKLK